MLVDEHADRNAAEVEAVQEILDVLVGHWVVAIRVLVLQHTLGHGGHDIIVAVPDGDQSFGEPVEGGEGWMCQPCDTPRLSSTHPIPSTHDALS